MAKHLGDIGKDARDLITTDFPSDGTLKFTSQTKGDLTFKSAVSRIVKKDKSGPKEITSASVEPNYKRGNFEINGKINTTNDVTATATVKDLGIEGTKAELTASQSDRDGSTVQLGLSFKNAKLATKGNAVIPLQTGKGKKQPIKASLELSGLYKSLLFGIGVALNSDNVVQPKVEGTLCFTKNPFEMYGKVIHDLNEGSSVATASFYHKFSPDFKYGAEIEVDKHSSKAAANFVGELQMDSSTTVKGKCVLKTSVVTQGELRFAGSVKQKISPSVTSIVGLDLNVLSLLGSPDGSHSFGLDIKLQ